MYPVVKLATTARREAGGEDYAVGSTDRQQEQPNHVHAKEAVGHADSADQFGLKRGREQALQDDWINSVGTSWQSERHAYVARSEDIGQERDP